MQIKHDSLCNNLHTHTLTATANLHNIPLRIMAWLDQHGVFHSPSKANCRVSNNPKWREVQGFYMTFVHRGPVCSWATSPEELLILHPNYSLSLKNTFTPSVCQTVLENNSPGPIFSTSWVESAKTAPRRRAGKNLSSQSEDAYSPKRE